MLQSGRWKEAVQAYLATIAYCDAQIGRLLDAFDKSPHKDNTIIVFWGDHGWHLGEKEHWRKFALWEEATRVPFIWVVPGVTDARRRVRPDRRPDERLPDAMFVVWPQHSETCRGNGHNIASHGPKSEMGPSGNDHVSSE